MNTKQLPKVAYFCMEYGLDTSLRTYAGGLGILAGDYLKGAKDHGFPMVGIGIKWKQGYTDQMIGEDGRPYDTYHNYEYDFMEDTGVKVTVKIRQRDVVCKVWKVENFGNVPLYLLDTDLPENEDSWITGQLYGWFGEERIAQEMVLGIGGVRALRALGIDVDVYHFNEGHAVFAGLELIREKMEKGMSFEDALKASREEIVFTTHTPIIQGNESHYLDRLMYMGANNGLTLEQMVRIGGAPFNMTVAALRLSRISNAVAQLHCQTANKMWAHIDDRSEIIGITNAIHLPTWVDERMIDAAENGGDLWETHMDNKRKLIEFIEERNGVKLDADKLLIGFSRRAAPYKRSNFIFTDENVISPLLEEGKIQIVFSGKAHPLDDTGKKIVENIVKMTKKYPNSVVFLENYDMTIGKMLTRGSDIWLNNPRRPKEASGTSGMKAAMNGVLNLSILDGWWPEACEHGVNGWQFGDGFESENVAEQDAHDLKALYKVLLEEVIPTYYNNREKWVEMMRNSILSTKDKFAVKRMLEEYYEKMYIKK
ncbi:alpha-glucan phosphorylase [Caloranaerobacter azorensis H53214]|uniref:glycogen phosphorylase n=2 Tax=Caloranaerobacter azorensis TaxID=116090 RepID=A0A1M5T337_9FIRM|nr:alpha-glucan family phosphorylase [Caloranaerobacter azorensis]KGG80509.1 alpha-glucan phosphorylase [Caloranaerobacter azorensis H53214]SHH45108.1 starch phosphorylase [Caloranaerobacter azorensis DSM 13643]